ncbi:MAG: hypothetical protein NXI31_15040 [bacterium]|nr:hypothetical protein [bacterium]
MVTTNILATSVVAALFAVMPSNDEHGATMSVNPDPLTEGGTATISYSDPSKANQTITIDIDNGMRRKPKKATVTIQLDENGEGATSWAVPGWQMANFNAPGVAEQSVLISPSS